MNLDHQQCYAAVQSRDARFDGRFFTGVLTTGIYCRPICPAITPRPENVRFFASASGAEAEGFRPCLRCHPEASPGTPDWQGSSALVSRALRLISAGLLDEEGVEDLATRMNVGARHLRRLFIQQLGAPPNAVAQTRRVHFAKQLIDETDLPMSEIAFSAGFSSIRRFNAAFRKAYDRPPTAVRRADQHGSTAPHGPDLQLKLAYRPPYNWPALVQFLQARAIPGVEAVDQYSYRRTVKLDGAAGVISVQHIAGLPHLLLSAPAAFSRSLLQIAERMRSMFDLRADPAVISNYLGRDRQLAVLVKNQPGVRIPGTWDGFELAVRAILGQQVSVRAANTLAGRLVAAYGEAMPANEDEKLAYLFPTPARLAEASLAEIGVMPLRAETIRALARAVLDGALAFETAAGLDEVLETLAALPGIGPWTANYIAMRAFSEPDAFPDGDLGLRRAAASMDPGLDTAARLHQRAEAWRPWRAYAAMLLWQSGSQPDPKGE